jgi:hypothetical protein
MACRCSGSNWNSTEKTRPQKDWCIESLNIEKTWPLRKINGDRSASINGTLAVNKTHVAPVFTGDGYPEMQKNDFGVQAAKSRTVRFSGGCSVPLKHPSSVRLQTQRDPLRPLAKQFYVTLLMVAQQVLITPTSLGSFLRMVEG